MGAYSNAVLADAPVLYWQLNEESGTEAFDNSRKGFTGTIKNAPSLAQTSLLANGEGKSMKFARASSQQVSRADNAELRGMTALTLEMVVKPATAPAEGQFYTLCFKGPASGHMCWEMDYRKEGGVLKVAVEVGDGTTDSTKLWTQTLSTTEATHLAATWDGTNIRLYVNGAPHASNPQADGIGTTLINTETNAAYLASFHEVDYFDGTIDEFAIYRTALSARRIEAHYLASQSEPGYPEVRGVGEYKAGIGAITPPVPTGTAFGDLLVYLAESVGTEAALTVAGWNTLVTSQTKEGTRLTALYKLATTKDLTVSNDTGDHQQGRIIAIKAGTFDETTIPNASGTGTQASTTAVSIPGGTSTLAKCLIVAANAGDLPDATGTAEFSGWTNADLTELVEVVDNTTAEGNGGSLGAATGLLATAKTWAATTATAATAAVRAAISAAIGPWAKPKSPYCTGYRIKTRTVGTSLTIEKPGEKGDVILLFCYLEADKTISVSGATVVGTRKYSTTAIFGASTLRIVHDGTPGLLTMTWEGSESKGAAITAVSYANVDPTTPVSVVTGWSEVAASASYSGAAVETTGENQRVVIATCNGEGTEPSAVSNNFVPRAVYSPVVVDKHLTAKESSGTTSWTYATSLIRLITTLALQPPATAGKGFPFSPRTARNTLLRR